MEHRRHPAGNKVELSAERNPHGQFPRVRLRRNRQADWSRRLVRETNLSVNDLIWPVFIKDGGSRREAVSAMPGVFRLTIPALVEAAEQADIEEGDWIEIDCLGAYSNANATHFNGFHTETWITVHDHPIGHVA